MKSPNRDDSSASADATGNALPDCLAVMYHYVRPDQSDPGAKLPVLDCEEFERQLDRLTTARQIIAVETYLQFLDGAGTIPARSALLTFDDGIIDHAEHVFPALKRRGIPGTFFVQTDAIENRRLDAAHMNHLLLASVDFDELMAQFEALLATETPGRKLCDFIDRGRARKLYHYETEPRASYKYAVAFGLPFELRDRLLARLFAEHLGDPREYADRFYLTWAQLADMQAAGMHVGGHSHRHNVYTRMTPDQQARDAAACAGILAERLGATARAFSYPYGRFDSDAISAVRSAGFVGAMTTVSRLNLGCVSRYKISRIDCIDLGRCLTSNRTTETANACG